MPQMSPMYWMILMFYFIMLLILMIMYMHMYFTINVIPMHFVKKLNVNKMNLMW